MPTLVWAAEFEIAVAHNTSPFSGCMGLHVGGYHKSIELNLQSNNTEACRLEKTSHSDWRYTQTLHLSEKSVER